MSTDAGPGSRAFPLKRRAFLECAPKRQGEGKDGEREDIMKENPFEIRKEFADRMTEDDLDYLLRQLKAVMEIDSPSGYIPEIEDYLVRELEDMGYAPVRLRKGGVQAFLGGQGNDALVAAHADTLGAVVRFVKPDGRLMLAPVGGLFAGHCERENVRVTTRDGRKYTGFIARANASLHIQSEEELAAKADFTKNVEVVLDEDVQSEQDVRALGVRAGDFVALDPRYTVTGNGYIKSRFLDDKAAVAVLLAYARHLKKNRLTPSRAVWAHFSLHEEIGHGATGGLPEGLTEILAMDMGCVGNFTEAGEKKVSVCAKDASFPYHYDVVTKLIETAEREGLDYGVDVYYPHYGSDANAALRAGLDLRHGLIGPGVYGCHDYERTHVEALKNTFLLLKAYFA